MASAATRIPPELFETFLRDVGFSGLANDSSSERKEAKRQLSTCSLTCFYWATQCRPRLFESLTLRSADDVRALRMFTQSSNGRLPSMLSQVHRMTAELRLTPSSPPWIHNLHIFIQSPCARAHIKRREMSKGPMQIYFHIYGPLPNPSCSQLTQTMTRGFLSATLPRTLPAQFRLCSYLHIHNFHFANVSEFTGLLEGIRFDSYGQHIPDITFKNVGVKNLVDVDGSLCFFVPIPAHVNLKFVDCTESPASLLWASLKHLSSVLTKPPQLQASEMRLSREENLCILGITEALLRKPLSSDYSSQTAHVLGRRTTPLSNINGNTRSSMTIEVHGDEAIPISPRFHFHATSIEDGDEWIQHRIESVVIDLAPYTHDIELLEMYILAYDWAKIGIALRYLYPSTAITINHFNYGMGTLFSRGQPRREMLNALSSKFALTVQYYRHVV